MGFTFDDTDTEGAATPLAEMRRLIDENPRNREVIFPYIGGKEVNTSPTHAHHRYVVNFQDWPLRRVDLGARWRDANGDERRDWRRAGVVPLDYPDPVAADWPDLLVIVENKVRPERVAQNRKALRERWWHYAEKQRSLYATVAGLGRVLVTSSSAATFHTLANISAGQVFSHKLIIFTFTTCAVFCALQARPHEIWSAAFGATLGNALTYNPTDVFETFPFPEGWETDPALEAAGAAYYDFRAALMVDNDEGLTKTYNRFHDPEERSPEIAELRALHAAMDRAVLDAYGWRDVPAECEFLLDHEIDEEAGSGRRRKPWRYRWPDTVRDDVLARLLALNAARATAERLAGATAAVRR